MIFNLCNLENVLQRNLRTGTARECIFRASGGTRFKNFRQTWWRKGWGGTPRMQKLKKIVKILKPIGNFGKNGRGTILPYLDHLGPKWKIDCNSGTPDPIFIGRGLLEVKWWENCKYIQIKPYFTKKWLWHLISLFRAFGPKMENWLQLWNNWSDFHWQGLVGGKMMRGL